MHSSSEYLHNPWEAEASGLRKVNNIYKSPNVTFNGNLPQNSKH